MSTAEKHELDKEVTTTDLNYLRWLRDANRDSGKGLFSLVWELSRLMLGKGKLQPEDYFRYRLYDDERYSPEAKQTFIGAFGPRASSPWADIANDKLCMGAYLQGLGLPTPTIQAVYHPTRIFGGALLLRSNDEVATFLREQASYPIFGKPIDGICSLGIANITRYDQDQDQLEFSSGSSMSVDAFVQELDSLNANYLFQTRLEPHADLIPITGNRVSTVRMFAMVDEHGPSVFRASWKLPAGSNEADNFWRAGNVLAGIDAESGKIHRVFRRAANGDPEPISAHPDTQTSFDDLTFPCWDAMKATVVTAAGNLPGCFIQGWDVALTADGPVLIELEGDGGSPIMEQLCFDTGLLQQPYLQVLEYAQRQREQHRKMITSSKSKKFKRRVANLANPTSADDQDDSGVVTESADESKTDELVSV